jgi:hypothetical protein
MLDGEWGRWKMSNLKINDGELYKAVILSPATFPHARYCLHSRKEREYNKISNTF